jgi:uncharacterized protein (TIGR03663 family)
VRRFSSVALALFLLGLALLLRLPQLGNRPFHADEAVHAVKFRELWEHGRYHYDPNEFHGPTIYYAALPTVAASGHKTFVELQEADMRLAIALIGAALVPLFLLLRKQLGTSAMLWAELFAALSPALVFYSRYFIQEVFLVVFTLVFLASAVLKKPIAAGIAAGLMVATKETAVLTFFAAGVAWALTTRPHPREKLPYRSYGLAAGIALAVAYVILSGFFSNPAGPLGYFKTYTPWLHRAAGVELHKNPWFDYLERFFWHRREGVPLWSEGLILLLGILGALKPPTTAERPFVRFLALFTLFLTVGYSLIPYKTPWCALNFLMPLILLAGVGAAGLIETVQKLPGKVLIAGLILLASAHLGWLSYQTSFVHFASNKNPYVFSPTVPDVAKLKTRIEDLAKVHPDHDKLVIKVLSKDGYYWPLPWYLRRFENIGYWTQLPTDPDGPIVLASPEFDEALTPKLKDHIMTGFFALRPDASYELFVKMSLWEPYLKQRGPVEDEE